MQRDDQFVFVQYYGMLGDEEVPNDTVDEALDFIRLKWERHGENDEQGKNGNVFPLCPLYSVRGRDTWYGLMR